MTYSFSNMEEKNKNSDSDRNYSVWWWYIYQRKIVLFLDLLIRKKYKLIPFNKLFFEKIKRYGIRKELQEAWKLKERIWKIIKKWPNSDILLEWKGVCFEDINFLYKTKFQKENYVFIQCKGNSTDNKIGIWRFKEIIINFYKNINFKNDISKNIFIIVTNFQYSPNIHNILKLSKEENIKDHQYYSLITDLIDDTNNSSRKKIQNNKAAIKKTSKMKKNKITEKIINDLKLNNDDISNITKYFWIDRSILEENIRHIHSTLKRTYLIEHLSEKYIDEILSGIHKWNYISEWWKVWDISTDKREIEQWSEEFEKYLFYWNTYFIDNKKANEVKSIENWKFFN